jgi:hypothetical protein
MGVVVGVVAAPPSKIPGSGQMEGSRGEGRGGRREGGEIRARDSKRGQEEGEGGGREGGGRWLQQ